ncbi:MAG TPA: PIG-L family deacetylase [Anaerohalosphaeraceae bacterium]|jgi:LmbE family N-acetylglucosaminyl deacetylase|nr:PIG-L family deacetylase [Anaerohalosphaeraceae bacterium]HRT51530.1 PIG-L family deacetylase [Anaerohalosphaeraceae bacterium]HRT87542.1 PIG-L family deacetylase [Anaerohalosphaeraceae bacterium]
MAERKVVLSIGAHPDDAEFLCAGTLALLRQRGWQVHIATLTPGDCGTVEYSREEIGRIRTGEAAKAAAMLDGFYHCVGCDDVFIMYDRPTLVKVIELVRRVRPRLVFTLCGEDYMTDHVTTGRLAMTACFACGIVNVETPGAEPFEPVPHLYYCDPTEGRDIYGQEVPTSDIVDISSVIETKERMLACHESQRNWLLAHHGIDEYVNAMKNWSAERGRQIGAAFGEGFRQHKGHAFPQTDLLAEELGALVHISRGA